MRRRGGVGPALQLPQSPPRRQCRRRRRDRAPSQEIQRAQPNRDRERVLVRCCAEADKVWNPDFSAFAAETIAWLAGRGVKLIGIDTPSVDPASSKSLNSHQMLLRLDLRVLENLVLDQVEAGDYELIALPLKLAGACASPVRAVLREQ